MNKFTSFFTCLILSIQLVGQVQIGSDIPGEAEFDWSGYDVDMSSSGDTVVIGAPLNDANGNKSGHVRVFVYFDDRWQQLGNDIDGEVEEDRCGLSVAISGDGRRVILGCPHNGDLGLAKVYEYNGTDWVPLGFDIEDATSGDAFARSVDISEDGSTIVVGAPIDQTNGSNSGAVYTYRYNGAFWERFGSVLKGTTDSQFGYSVALSFNGSRLAIGSPFNDERVENAGAVRVFRLDNNDWNQLGRTLYGDNTDDEFGSRVRLDYSGSFLATSAPKSDIGAENAGSVFVYHFANDWVTRGEPITGKRAGDFSGGSDLPYFDKAMDISGNGNVIVVGSPSNDDFESDAGQARVFTYLNNEWVRTSADIEGDSPGDNLGNAVTINSDGTKIGIGVRFDSPVRNQEGSVKIFEGVTITSTKDSRVGSSFIVSPNPANDYLDIDLKEIAGSPNELLIYSSSGLLVYRKSLANNINLRLNINQLNPGFYKVLIRIDNRIISSSSFVKN